ncbi:MAG TPA: ATP-binding protein [Acidimicrobiales bacterium]|jgi:anti-sigma regulatory factor (Ser/Thr protein kinase)|nr:ATP-binding protein [Acidimicrobiales bacterium]
MGQSCEIEMAGDTASIRQARSFVTATLAAWHLERISERAVLLVSELATNAVLHARTPFRLSVRFDDSVTVEVTDGSAEFPKVETSDRDGDRGRGLLLVSRLASDWGSRSESAGKTVWFSLDPGPA